MTAPAESKPAALKTHDIMKMLRQRYAGENGFALLENVANGVGNAANGRRRHADALAMAQWGKSGHFLHGFEVKASRGDWLRELKDESKADSVFRYCDFWWVAVGDAAIVKDGELPNGWGLLAPRGDALVTRVEAVRQVDVVVHDRAFVASIFRRAKEQQVDKALLAAERTLGFEQGKRSGEAGFRYANERLSKEVDRLREQIAEFQAATGIPLDSLNGYRFGTTAGDLGRAVKLLLAGERQVDHVAASLTRLRSSVAAIDHAIAEALGEARADPPT